MDYDFERSVDITMKMLWEDCFEKTDFCDQQLNLVCHCDGWCMCVPGGDEGDTCSPYIDGADPMCKYGYGCLD